MLKEAHGGLVASMPPHCSSYPAPPPIAEMLPERNPLTVGLSRLLLILPSLRAWLESSAFDEHEELRVHRNGHVLPTTQH